MDSRWNPEGGYSIPHGREFLLGSSPWGVSTPEKSIPPRAHATPIHQNGSMQDDMNWPELAGLRNSYSQDMPYYNRGSVQGLNLEMRAPENEYLGDEAVFLPRQQMMNHIADSSVSDFGVDGASWANSSFMDLLTSNDFSFGLSVDGTLSSGLNIAQKPWSLSYPSSSSCEDFTSHNILTASQKNAANTNTSSKDYIATPIPQYGFPLHSWQNYDLNSTPVIDVEPLPSITKSLHFTPVTPDQAKTRNHQLSAVLNSSAAYENTIQEKEKQEMFPLTSHEATHNHSDELLQNIVESFTQKQEVIKQSNESIDLNSTPQLKQPKRKRHRPKVILEGKPKRTRKSATQENPSGKDNPSGKRKYVRKKGLKQSVSQQADAAQETVVSNDRLTAKSCRRALNFDLEKTADASTIAGKGGVNILQASSSCAESQTSELYRTAHNVSGIISAQQIGQQDRSVMVCQPEILNMLNTSADQRPCEFIPEPERLVNCPPVKITDKPGHYASTQDVGWAMGLDCQNGPTDGQFLGQQQFVHARVGQFNAPGPDNLMKSQQVVPPSASLIFSHSNEARGIKRDLQHTNNQTYLLNANSGHPQFLAQQMCQNDECWKSSSILNSTSMVIQKKKKTEKGLDINSTSTSVSAVDDFSGQTSIAGLTGEITFKTSVKKPEMLKSYEASDSINLEGPNILNRYTNELFLRSSAMSFKSREHQISIEQHSYQQRKDTNRSQVKDIGVTAYEKYHQNQMVPETTALLGNKEMPRKQHAILSAKNTAGPTKQKSSKEKFQKEQGNLSCKDQFSIAMMKGSSSSSMERDPNSLNKIIYRLKMLNLGEGSNMKEADQHAIVPYKGVGTIVPYEGLEHIRRRKPRPKVDLDPETNRIWNLLMGKEKGGLEENDEEKEKRWEEEREVFRGRANSFIARMHLVQGDRRFSQWKGSVVDSVIGVFLTQNVSDHLSSSAFMSLAARFPQKPTCYGRDCGKNQTNILVKEPEIIMLNPTNTIRFHTKTQPIYSKNSVTLQEPTECWQVSEIPGTERMKLLEGQTHSSEEEGLSSQESFDCSINESIGGIRSYSGSNSESEDLIVGQRPEEICYSNLETTSQKEKFIVQDLNIHPSQNTITYENNQSKGKTYNLQNSGLDSTNSINGTSLSTCLMNYDAQSSHFPPAAFIPHKLQINSTSGMPRVEDTETFGEESISSWPRAAKFSDSGANRIANQIKLKESQSKTLVYRSVLRHPQETRVLSHHASLSTTNSFPQSSISGPDLTISQPSSILHQCESENIFHHQTSLPIDSEIMGHSDYGRQCNHLQHESFSPSQKVNVRDRISKADDHSHQESVVLKPNSEEQQSSSSKPHKETSIEPANAKRGKAKVEKTSKIDWDILRRNVQVNGQSKERSADAVDSIDYEAIRQASVSEISNCIKERGMNNMLAERIKGFLDRLVQDHGSIDLEWLRDISPDKAKDYLLSVRGLGLKSVECVRLLTLRHLAFPVDTNVGRIAVRLGWVPLQPLPESLQLHLLELYPVLESIQKYLWPRLCKLDQRTLYELHYQLITFGKVFCTKSKPNCNACPMRGECRHFASAFASARLALPAPEEKSLVCSTVPLAESEPETMINLKPLQPPYSSKAMSGAHSCEPIIEEPATPDEERAVALESDIEDVLNHDDEEIPTIKLNMQEFTENLQQFMQENKMELQEGDMSKALVAINPEAASIPARKLKNVSRLRTEHQVYELPDDHPLLQGLQKRELDDPSPYLLAIWTPGETANSVQQSQEGCKLQNSGNLCNERTCFSCNSIREANSQTVRGTLLIPCRTAMKGSFPLNGTYFQVNEVFADHESSENPIHVPRDSIWSLRRRTVYFGTSVTTIFRGLSTEEIQYCFWRGFVCVRGFHRSSRAPRPLVARLHFPASKAKTKK